MMFYHGMGGLWRGFGDRSGNMGSYMHNGWGLILLGMALLVAVLVVVLIVVLVKRSHRNHPVYHRDESLELLNERFARGDITEEEYKHMKQVLAGK